MLYLRMLDKYGSRAPVEVRKKFYKELPPKKVLLLLPRDYNIHGSWLIVSVIYPEKSDLQLVSQPKIDEFFNSS